MNTTISRPGEAWNSRRAAFARAQHPLFIVLALVAALVVAVGFGSKFVGPQPPNARPHTTLVLVHAAVFASWIVIFGVQTALAATHRLRIHRRLGAAAALLAVTMIVLGYVTAIQAARTGFAPIPGGAPLGFLVVPLGDLVVFGAFASAGLYCRRNREVHKRLMWLATAMLTFPAVTRIPVLRGHIGPMFGVFLAILLIAPLYEWLAAGRVHRITIWGSAAVFLSLPARQAIGHTHWWHSFAAWLIR